MGEDLSVHRLFHRVHKKIIMNFRHKLEPYDFTRGEFPLLLWLIRSGDGVTQKDICSDLPVSKSTTSKMINNLVEKGYLRKEKDEEDRRKTRIYLTERRKEVRNIIKEVDKRAEELMMKGFDEEEKEELKGYLYRILQNIEGESE